MNAYEFLSLQNARKYQASLTDGALTGQGRRKPASARQTTRSGAGAPKKN